MYFQTFRHILFYFLHYFRHSIFGFVFSNTCYVSYFGIFNHDDFKDMIHCHPYFRPFVILNISSLIFNLCFMLQVKLILNYFFQSLLNILEFSALISCSQKLLNVFGFSTLISCSPICVEKQLRGLFICNIFTFGADFIV